MTTVIISAVIGILIGGIVGYVLFRYVITGKYKQMIEAANNEAEVIKEKKLLEVKEKFLNKKSELEKRFSREIRKSSRARTGLSSVRFRSIRGRRNWEDASRRLSRTNSV